MIQLKKVDSGNIWEIIKLSVNHDQINLKIQGPKNFMNQWDFLKTEKCAEKKL